MQSAVPEGVGAMAAILGLAPAQVAGICRQAADGQVVAPANLNSPEQTVISGHAEAVKRAVELASAGGAAPPPPPPLFVPLYRFPLAPAPPAPRAGPPATPAQNITPPLCTHTPP